MKKDLKKKRRAKVTGVKNVAPSVFSERAKIIFPGLLVLLTFIVYYPVLRNGFTNWDDAGYITTNNTVQDINATNLRAIFTGYQMGNYHPLTLLSLAKDWFIGGNNPLVFHITSLLLHIINTLLVFSLLLRLIKSRTTAFVAALLFGISTLHVESAAWISERKDVLYSMFFLFSLLAYTMYIDKLKWKWYLLSLFLFILSLFSKGQAVTLSVTLLLADYFTGRKLNNYKVLAEKVPFFVLSVIFGIIAIKAQKHGNSLVDLSTFTLLQRICFASYGFIIYLIKLLIPFRLSAIYPYPDLSVSTLPVYFQVFPFLVIAMITSVFVFFRKNKLMVFGFLFFSVNIFTVLQLLPVGSAIMADRYSYIPSVGLFLLTAAGIVWLAEKYSSGKRVITGVFVVYIIVISIITGSRVKVWRNSETLWTDVIEKYPQVMTAWDNRGNYYSEKTDYRRAIKDYTQAIKLKPDYADAYYNRGIAFYGAGEAKAAVADYNIVAHLKPGFAENYYNRGVARHALGDRAGALADYSKAVELVPLYYQAYSNRGNVKRDLNDIYGAISDYSKAVELRPDFDDALSNRGSANGVLGKYDEAIRDFDRAIQVNPKYHTAWYLRGMAKIKQGRTDDACRDLARARQLGNQNAEELIKIYCKR
jgi:Tfp pilus assembly protein PilF